MSTYTYIIDYAWVHNPEEVSGLVEDEDFPTLTNAEQIISVCWDALQNAYLVTWRVRKWLGGGEA